MNYRNGIAILLLLAVSAIAGGEVDSLRVASINVITTENHLYPSAPVGITKSKNLQVNFPVHQVYHYFPGAQIYNQTVESVDMETRTVTMSQGDTITTKVFPAGKTEWTNIAVISLSTGEIWSGTPGNTLSNRVALSVSSPPTGTTRWGIPDNTNIIHLTITELDENGGITVTTPKNECITIPKVTTPELIELGKQKSQQAGAGYPPQSVGSPDP